MKVYSCTGAGLVTPSAHCHDPASYVPSTFKPLDFAGTLHTGSEYFMLFAFSFQGSLITQAHAAGFHPAFSLFFTKMRVTGTYLVHLMIASLAWNLFTRVCSSVFLFRIQIESNSSLPKSHSLRLPRKPCKAKILGLSLAAIGQTQ